MFCRYQYSIKGLKRAQRTISIASNGVLSLSTPIPSKEDTILSTGNKVQIIDIISKYLIEKLENTNYRINFVVAFSTDIPVRVENGVVSKRTDPECLHEEAVINIIKQRMACVKDKVFWQGCKSKVLMDAFDTSQSLIDINEIAKKDPEIISSPITANALSGFKSLPKLYGIGKITVIKHLKDQNLSLSSEGDTAASLANVYAESTKLFLSCYCVKNVNNLFEVRFLVCGKRTGKKLTSTTKLESLPPTTEVYEACVWDRFLQPRPQIKCIIIESGSLLIFWLFTFI